MKRIITIVMLAAASQAADVVLGRLSDLTWTGTGADRVANFGELIVYAASSDFTYTTNNNEITITGYVGAGGQVNVPPYINGYPVTELASWSVYNLAITGWRCPNTLRTIGYNAFQGNTGITVLVFGTGISQIYDMAFQYCYGLQKIYFLGDAPTIGSGIFKGAAGTIYYRADAAGFTNPWADRPTAIWTSYPDPMP